MHSRIYNLDKIKYTEDEVFDMVKYACPMMDYVDSETNIDDDCEWLLGSKLPVKGRTITETFDYHW